MAPRQPRRSARMAAAARASALYDIAIAVLASSQSEEDTLTGVLLLELARRKRVEARSGKHGQRGPYDRVKSEDVFNVILHASERIFKSWLRVGRDTFWHIHELIKDDPIFVSPGRRPQRPVEYQLATFLIRAGRTPGVKAATAVAIAEGTSYLYCKRVRQAIRNRRDDHLAWPGPERRAYLRREFHERGFPGCLGSGDGTLIPLEVMPREGGHAYWCRKKFYAFTVLAIVDHRGIFLAYDFGWPGSVTDSTVWNESHIWRFKERYFRQDEYILVDKGYPLTAHTMRPFAEVELTNDAYEADLRKKFNQKLSHERVAVEHAFGRLKGRFPCLRGMSGYDTQEMYRVVEALFILHNIAEEFGDDPTDIEGYNGLEDAPVLDRLARIQEAPARAARDSATMYRMGLLRRKKLMDHLELV